MIEVTDIKGIGPAKADTLDDEGYSSVEDIAQADRDALASVDGVGEDRALEFMVAAGDLLDAEQEVEDETEGEEFDLTPSEVSDELEDAEVEEEDDSPEVEVVDEEEEDEAETEADESEDESDPSFSVELSFDEKLEYDVFHAALMRHHERVYTSYQPASDVMQKLLDGLTGFDSVSYELTEFELNTLHTAVKQTRSDYQGNNQIDHMDALNEIEDQIDEDRREYLF